MRCLLAESRLAASVFEGDFAEAAFTDVVARSLVNVSQFGETIVLGRRYNSLTTVSGTCFLNRINEMLYSSFVHVLLLAVH